MKTVIATLMIAIAGMANIPAAAMQVGEDVVRDKVSALVREQVTPYLNGASVEVDVLQVPGAPYDFPQTEKLSDVTFEMDSPLSNHYSDRAVVRVSMSSSNGRTRDFGVPVKLTVTKPVWVVKHLVSAKSRLKASDFELETREVSRELTHVAGREVNLREYIARVNLAPGQLLDTRRIQMPNDVSRNEEVLVTISNGKGMNISVMAEAMADGRVGDTIRVRHTRGQTRKYYTGTIVSKNRVQVDI